MRKMCGSLCQRGIGLPILRRSFVHCVNNRRSQQFRHFLDPELIGPTADPRKRHELMHCNSFFSRGISGASMLLPNCQIVDSLSTNSAMSHNESPLPYRKKLPKHPSVSLHDSHNNKLSKVTSIGSNIGESDSNERGKEKLDSSIKDHFHPEKSRTPSSSSRISTGVKSANKTSVERKNSYANFNGKKNDAKSAGENSSPQMIQFNRKLEKESELVGMLGKQLYLAENHLQRMQTVLSKADDRLKDKEQENARLKRKVREWEVKFRHQEILHKQELQNEKKQVEDSEYLYRRCLMLEHKIYEMEKFLADYGLTWVGDAESGSKSSEKKSDGNCLKNCYTQLLANIEELNLAVGKGEVHVQKDKGGGGASFKTPSCMSLKFYKNGLVVQNGRIRPYEHPEAASFIRDILDGYFPSELQQAYPNGVPFKVEDYRTECFHGDGAGFPGHGYRLGKIFPTGGNQSLRSARSSFEQRQNFFAFKPTVPPSVTTNYAKSTKSKSFSESPPPLDMMQLRSQILASHNNNCSDSHIQSHINAELVLSSRIEKKRELATKEAECHISLKERTLGSKPDNRNGSQRFLNANERRASNHSSTDRSSDLQISPGRFKNTCSDEGRSRSRSTSLPGRNLRLRSLSKPKISPENSTNSTPKNCYNVQSNTGVKKPRASRSATLERKTPTAVPIVNQVNQPSGKPNELRLKIRSLNGSTVYLVHLCPEDTVGKLYHLLDNCLVKTRLRGYKIVISGYASKRLEQLNVSLREYGIVRDSVLHIVNDSII